MTLIITIPKIVAPVIDRTDLNDERVIFLLIWEAKPLWVTGVIPGSMFDIKDFQGWVAFESSPQKTAGKKWGIFFPKRPDAILCAEQKIENLAKLLFPQSSLAK